MSLADDDIVNPDVRTLVKTVIIFPCTMAINNCFKQAGDTPPPQVVLAIKEDKHFVNEGKEVNILCQCHLRQRKCVAFLILTTLLYS